MLNLKERGLDPVLFCCGDNTCVSNECIVTPCKNVSSGSKNAFNFYHSQVRISVEYSFGLAILRVKMPTNVPLRNATSLACYLRKL